MSTRDEKLIQYLNEAYGKEKELETALQAHISMTTRPPYKKRLQQHLKETKAHARGVERRIKQLGGSTESNMPAPVAEATPEPAPTAAHADGAAPMTARPGGPSTARSASLRRAECVHHPSVLAGRPPPCGGPSGPAGPPRSRRAAASTRRR